MALSDSGLLLSETDAKGRVHRFEYDTQGKLIKDIEPSGAFQSLSREDDGLIIKSNALGHSFRYARSEKDGAQVRTVTLPDGRSEYRTIAGLLTVTLEPDGTLLTQKTSADPRWGMQSSYPSRTSITLPSGLTSVIELARTVTLSDPDEPASVVTTVETKTIKDGPRTVRTYDATARTLTLEALGDRTVTSFNAEGRSTEHKPSGALAPLSYAYDELGRLASITQGERKTSFTYDEHDHRDRSPTPLARASTKKWMPWVAW